jgi:Mn-dependent DtxR family transcriptional regulator
VGCKALRRKAEALALSTGDGGKALARKIAAQLKRQAKAAAIKAQQDKIDADMPVLVAKGRTYRDLVAAWIEFQIEDPKITKVETSRRLGISQKTLHASINRAVKEGWLKFDDPLSRIEHEIVPKVVDNLNHFLDKKDKTVTIEAAKGTIFKTYLESKGISEAPQTVLALKIETVDGDAKVIEGHVLGKPRVTVEELCPGQK